MAKVNLYGVIGSSMFNEGISAKQFISDFEAAKKIAVDNDEELIVGINSPGGSLFEGLAICNHLLASDYPVTTRNEGVAISMAFAALQCGKKRTAYKATSVLAHSTRGFASGTVTDLKNAIQLMEALNDNIADMLATKTGLSKEEVHATYLDDKDHSFTASKALELKLIDEIEDVEAENVPTGSYEDIMASFTNSDKSEKSFLDKITNRVASVVGKLATPEVSATVTEDINTPMNIDNELLVLASVEATEKQKSDASAAIKSAFTADVVFTQEEVDTKIAAAVSAAEEVKNTEITSLQDEVKALGAAPAAEPTAKGDTTDVVETKVDEVAALMAKGQASGFYKTSRIIED